jgi:hypothetical protein
MNEIEEVYRDHLDECLKHFGKWFNSKMPRSKHGRYEALKPMLDFFGMHYQTAQRWLDDVGVVPVGEYRIKLMCYLDLHGYKIIEFERMDKALRNFAELIGFGLLSAEQAGQIIDCKEPSHLYRILWGNTNLVKDKQDQMYLAWKERREGLEKKKEQSFELHRVEVLFRTTSRVQSAHQIEMALPSSQSNGLQVGSAHTAVLQILEGSLSLIEGGLFEGLSDSELANFAQPILQLSSRFSVLSSKVLDSKRGH